MHTHGDGGMGMLAYSFHLCTQVWGQEDYEFDFEGSLG